MRLPSGTNWGATDEERHRRYPADTVLDLPADRLVRLDRAVTVDAPAALTFRWLCQLSIAPYSYDLLDNRGRKSPSQLVPGSDQLAVGQEMMVFRLTEVQPGSSFTGRGLPKPERLFGPLAVTYAVHPLDDVSSRLVCRLVLAQDGWFDRLRGALLVWGDLIMMRKEFLTLKRYAERDAH
ncbi:MAG: hypothetical protein JWQ81_7865 [Amycolatopsis sp.]|jgi:hypothetical protein|uniref:hypothetical protein n=1 Tax=Amycolatopsis sp. TaxID=37632 RepID=UPI0026059215|nr:hypothetical protein [Amycolatopsis sp.]MCU1687126.1 hypothetical protein [Amycolatopsis sp.]